MTRAKIIRAPQTGQGWFSTTTKNTGLSQRETLEEVIANLASALGIETIHKQIGSRGNYFYEVQSVDFKGFQSASNTILELSRVVALKAKEVQRKGEKDQ